jgi:pimeloyl-ACP methyl ester carboxylesterase
MIKSLALAAGATLPLTAVPADAQSGAVRNVVLVHGAFADGAGWRGVYDELTTRGYKVSIVRNPLTSFEDDVAATRRVLARQDGPAILVGPFLRRQRHHRSGRGPGRGRASSTSRPLRPRSGQSTLDQYAVVPPPPNFQPDVQRDGFAFLKADTFKAGFAADTTEAQGAFLRDSQVPIAMKALEAKVTAAAWRSKPSWYVIATEDGAIAPNCCAARRSASALSPPRWRAAMSCSSPSRRRWRT